MLITGFPAGPWATNCYVVAPSSHAECIVIDPGYESLKQIKEIVAENKLKPIATLLTHGHIDHMWSVTPLADGYGIPAMIHEADRALLSHPERGVSDAGREMILQLGGKFSEPQSVSTIQGDSEISLLGFTFSMLHLPGHTPGSIAYHLAEQRTLFSGDVLFESGIGRTDLPGGSSEAMKQSVRKLFDLVSDETTVLCGHGSQTTIGAERMNNPYIQDWLQHA